MSDAKQGVNDPYLWLENIYSERSTKWVQEQNKKSEGCLAEDPIYHKYRDASLKRLESSDKLVEPYLVLNDAVYNFWTDQINRRGLLRRCSYDSFVEGKEDWEMLLDVDKLGKEDGRSWVYHGLTIYKPEPRFSLISLSDGGKDAHSFREFDLVSGSFVKNGFSIPEGKTWATWKNSDEIWVSDGSENAELTSAGYPLHVKLLKRGRSLQDAEIVFSGESDDMMVSCNRIYAGKNIHTFFTRVIDFYTSQRFILDSGEVKKLHLPESIKYMETFENQLILALREPWALAGHSLDRGTLVSLAIDDAIAGNMNPQIIWEPAEGVAVEHVVSTSDSVIISLIDKVKSRLLRVKPTYVGKGEISWEQQSIECPPLGSLSLKGVSRERSDFWYTFESFSEPQGLYYQSDNCRQARRVQNIPESFDSTKMAVEQHWVGSKDGTKVPYFLIKPKGEAVQSRPTILYGYGGFEVSLSPSYSVAIGQWVEQGGCYVVANIRGGGEFGPQWHQAALRDKRMCAYEDFSAVAKDLSSKGVASCDKLAIMGGSNGGLLVGASMVLHPELFRAVVCQVPLLDMQRYHHLLAGASWKAEYGDPDLASDWQFISEYSPYQNVMENVAYPAILFTTSTADDRVHPGHARKMAARMMEYGHQVLYYENPEGGHASGAEAPQIAHRIGLEYSFLTRELFS